jgi:hypothetical protein
MGMSNLVPFYMGHERDGTFFIGHERDGPFFMGMSELGWE